MGEGKRGDVCPCSWIEMWQTVISVWSYPGSDLSPSSTGGPIDPSSCQNTNQQGSSLRWLAVSEIRRYQSEMLFGFRKSGN